MNEIKIRQINEEDMDMVEKVGLMVEQILCEQLDTLNDAFFVASVVIAHIASSHGLPDGEIDNLIESVGCNIKAHYYFFNGNFNKLDKLNKLNN